MSALQAHAARTSATPQTAPPIMRRAAPQGRFAAPPIASLAAIPAAPAVQRKCTGCDQEDKEQPAVQPRLEVGPVGDRYEREADGIAAQVMAMRDPGAATVGSDASGAEPAVQRACSACSTSRDEPRARRFAEPKVEEKEPKVRASRDGGTETIAASDSELTGGGATLPAATRDFFEGRMGRDLGDVRVHQGGGSAAMNDSISARAFTYKNHVWLGAGESAGPSFTMAHELAHVMQQTAPGPVGARARRRLNTNAARAGGGNAPHRVMRLECHPLDTSLFFAPTDSKREDAEQGLIADLSKKGNVLGEVPIPNAQKDPGVTGCKALGKSGRADLVQTNGNMVGFQFEAQVGAQIPRPWYVPETAAMGCLGLEDKRLAPEPLGAFKDMYVGGTLTPVANWGKLAPVVGPGSRAFTTDAASAPTSVAIGEVKFGGTGNARQGARGQIDNYRAGLEFTRNGYENIRQNIDKQSNELEGGHKPTLAPWPTMTTSYLTKINGVPDDWQAQGDSIDLVTAKYIWPEGKARRCKNFPTVKGKLYHGHDSDLKFVWLYVWYPDKAPPGNAPDGGAKFTAYRETAAKLISEATTAPGTKPKVRKMPLAASPAVAKPVRKPKPAKPIPAEDPFKTAFPKWKEDRSKLAKDFKGFEKTDEFDKDTMRIQFNQALKNTTEITGKSPNAVTPDKSEKMVAAEKGLRNLEIITGPAGGLIGELRFRLGGVFTKILGAYDKLKTKIEEFFKRKPSSSGGDLKVRAFKVFTQLLGSIAAYMLPRVTDALIECVENGFRETLEKWIDDSPLDTIEEKFQGFMADANALKDDIFGEITTFVEKLFGPVQAEYEAVKKIVEVVADVVSIAKKAFDIARAAACLAGGLETAGISCVVALVDKLLGLINLSPSEHLLAWLLESCAAKEYFAKAMLAYQDLKKIPQVIAKKIVEQIRPALPVWLQSFVCNPKTMDGINADLPTWDEVACDGTEDSLDRSGRPGNVDTSVDRKPTDAETRDLGGFEKEKLANERPKAPKPPPDKPKPGDVAPPAPPTPPAPPAEPPKPASSEAAKDKSTPSTQATHVKPIEKLDKTGTKTGVLFIVHPSLAQGALPPKDYNKMKSKNRVSAVTTDNTRFGPTAEEVDIVIHRVFPDPGKSGSLAIEFSLPQAIRMTVGTGGPWLEASAGKYVDFTQVGAPM